MSRQVLSPRFRRLVLFMLDLLLRRSIRGCHIIWAVLWRFLKRSFIACPLRLRLLQSVLHRNKSGNSRRRPSYSNTYVRSPCYGLSDPMDGVSVQGTEVVMASAALPYMVAQESHSVDLSSSGINAEMLPTATAQTGDPVTLSILPAHPALRSSSSTSSGNHHGHGRSEDISSLHFSHASSSSETLNNIPMHPILVEDRSHSDANPAIPVVHTSNIISRLGSIGSRGSLWEISEYIWPMMPAEVPRYKNNRIM